jgi:ribosomal protein S12 methylthiotransferase accessory factor YcaO
VANRDPDAALWSKGILRCLEIDEPDSTTPLYIATANVPSGPNEYFQSAAGKGRTAEEAMTTLLGEAVERIAAWQLDEFSERRPPANARTMPLSAFHPFGSEYRGYDAITQSLAAGSDLINQSPVAVPFDLVKFPPIYEYRKAQSGGTTTGLAAHRRREDAILGALWECFERHSFFAGFLTGARGFTVPLDEIEQNRDLKPFASLISLGEELHLVAYPQILALPIVHAFIVQGDQSVVYRGSGAGFTLGKAAMSAITEAIQCRPRQGEENIAHPVGGVSGWSGAEAESITHYLRSLPAADRSIIEMIEPSGLEESFHLHLLRLRLRPIIVDIPTGLPDWYAVRVLVPGLTVGDEPSESDGGAVMRYRVDFAGRT